MSNKTSHAHGRNGCFLDLTSLSPHTPWGQLNRIHHQTKDEQRKGIVPVGFQQLRQPPVGVLVREASSEGRRRSIMHRIKPYVSYRGTEDVWSSTRPLRFQEGSVDEVSFESEDLGSLEGLLVGTESGTWRLDEAIVSSSTSGQVDRFICREATPIGSKEGLGALWLQPIPPGMTEYGNGDQATLLTASESRVMRDQGLRAYEDKASKVLSATAAFGMGGSLISFAWGGGNSAVCYSYGALVSLCYQWMLLAGVDSAVDKPPHVASCSPSGGLDVEAARRELEEIHTHTIEAERQGPFLVRVKGIVGNPALRLGFVAAAGVLAFTLLPGPGGEGASSSGSGLLLMGLLGFFSYKFALLAIELSSLRDPSNKNQMIES